jgi:hypothetical protein
VGSGVGCGVMLGVGLGAGVWGVGWGWGLSGHEGGAGAGCGTNPIEAHVSCATVISACASLEHWLKQGMGATLRWNFHCSSAC